MQRKPATEAEGVPGAPARRWAMLATCLALLGTTLASGWGSGADPRLSSASRPSSATAAATHPEPHGATPPKGNTTNSGPASDRGAFASTTLAAGIQPMVPHAGSTLGQDSAPAPALSSRAGIVSLGAPADALITPTPTTIPTLAAVASRASRFDGWLVGPDAISATYPVAGVDRWNATLSWSGAPVLTLSSDCAGVTETRSGSSHLSVSGGGPTCTLSVLASPDVVSTTFHLAVDPQ